jgi:hypothetical protein
MKAVSLTVELACASHQVAIELEVLRQRNPLVPDAFIAELEQNQHRVRYVARNRQSICWV